MKCVGCLRGRSCCPTQSLCTNRPVHSQYHMQLSQFMTQSRHTYVLASRSHVAFVQSCMAIHHTTGTIAYALVVQGLGRFVGSSLDSPLGEASPPPGPPPLAPTPRNQGRLSQGEAGPRTWPLLKACTSLELSLLVQVLLPSLAPACSGCVTDPCLYLTAASDIFSYTLPSKVFFFQLHSLWNKFCRRDL